MAVCAFCGPDALRPDHSCTNVSGRAAGWFKESLSNLESAKKTQISALALGRTLCYQLACAGVAELVDAPDLGSGAYGVGVRVPSPAPIF